MKNTLIHLIKWFCRHLTYNELASAVPVLLEVLGGQKKYELKQAEDRPPHYRDYRVDTTPPLNAVEEQRASVSEDWQVLLNRYQQAHGKPLRPIQRRGGIAPPPGCCCAHCGAPHRYLWANNGHLATQLRCKVCGRTCPTHGRQRESHAVYRCPYCSRSLSRWKESEEATTYKCFSYTCPHYLEQKARLTEAERGARDAQKYDPNYKLHYQYREYHIDFETLRTARPSATAPVDLNRIHNSHHVVGLVLSFTINLGLSSRLTRNALKGLFGIEISHQTVINYANMAAARLAPYVDEHCPPPAGIAAADETYIIVEGEWEYTWFVISAERRAICGYNLSNHRDTQSALALLVDTYGKPSEGLPENAQLVTDGLVSYDSAIMAYNAQVPGKNTLSKHTVTGLKNDDPESTEYREFKQLIERLNRTYKYHTRPRAGFKSFAGAVSLTTLFVAYYNFMRPHMALANDVPVKLDCIKRSMLMPDAWVALLKDAA